MNDKGVRRPETGDPILDKRGKVVGTVTSCAIDSDGYLLGQAVVPMDLRRSGTIIDIYQTGGGSRALRVPNNVKLGARMPRPDSAGAEAFAGRREHEHAGLIVLRQRIELALQRLHHRVRQRVQRLGPVQRQRDDPARVGLTQHIGVFRFRHR